MALQVFPFAGRMDGKPYNTIAEGIGPTVVMDVCTVAKPEAEADIIVVPGLNVVLKFADAYVIPLCIIIEVSIFPTLISEDERLIVVSCTALAGRPLESCNCTKTQLYVLLSASKLAGPA